MPNQIYSLKPSTIIVTSSFEENVKKLESVCIPPRHIIDIYIESQKYAQNIRDMTNPMRFIEARESEDEFSDIRFRQLERAYNDVVRSWSKLKPLSFIQQYEAYVTKRPNKTGIENGIASQVFFRFTNTENNTLVVDPSPSFIKQQHKYNKPEKEREPLTPRQLRDYYNSIANQLGIPEIKLSVDVESSSQATTDISDYQGDFLRCNFDFHARYDTKLETESINYLMGRKLETTEGQYYCDYRAKLMQLLMRAQLDQWAARYFAPPPISGVTRILPQKEMLSHIIAPSNQPVRTRIELDIDPSGGGDMDSILLQIFARYGGAFSVHFYPEEENQNA